MLQFNSRSVRGIIGGSVLAVVAGLSFGLTGCDLSGPDSSPSQARSHIPRSSSSNLPPNYEGAAPDGAAGSDAYDQPGALPGNAGGTNAGRSGADDQKQFENR
jgi:hypothetical protein